MKVVTISFSNVSLSEFSSPSICNELILFFLFLPLEKISKKAVLLSPLSHLALDFCIFICEMLSNLIMDDNGNSVMFD